MSSKIYIIGHKPVEYGFWNDELYTPIQVGNGERFLEVRDTDGGDNPYAEWNAIYAETTASWWIAHNETADYVGQSQYRRRLKFEPGEVEKIMEDYDVICSEPLALSGTLERNYGINHSLYDIEDATAVIHDLFPSYEETWRKVREGSLLYYSNSFIMRNADYKRYVEWLYSITEEMRKRRGWDTLEHTVRAIEGEIAARRRNNTKGLKYQAQVFGFLSERLLTLFVTHNFTKIYHKPYTKFEQLGKY